MPRIRSIHPGLFTDDAFMSLSIEARIFLIGLWCEADDQGIFQVKPPTLKARIFPANDIDVVALINELEAHKFVKPFEENGCRYGAIRNFRKWQRPKKPNAIHPLPSDLRSYVRIDSDRGKAVTNHFPTRPENPAQREDGGEEGKEDEGGLPLSSLPTRIRPGHSKNTARELAKKEGLIPDGKL